MIYLRKTAELLRKYLMESNATEIKPEADHAFDHLLPTLIECFAVIICGNLSRRFGLLSNDNMRGINYFTTNFALPSLLFLSLANLDLQDVDWPFVAGITLSKFIIFIGVAIFVVLLVKPISMSKIAIYAIFCTHVNDYGLAFPILQAVYEEHKPKYPTYIYLIGLISLVVLNPIGFFLLEIERALTERRASVSGSQAVSLTETSKRVLITTGAVLKRILTNPNVFMTVFGVTANYAFKGKLPEILFGIFYMFSSTFQGSVLFVLGYQVAFTGKRTQNRVKYLIPITIIAVKMLLTPLVTRGAVQLTCQNSPDADDLADYGFLYGTVPTAPVVLLYASQYKLPTEMLATSLVVCTLLSGPLMYISARLLVVQELSVFQYMLQIRETILSLAVLSLLAILWVTFIFIVNKRWKKPPHSITQCLLFSQALTATGLLIWSTSGANGTWSCYIQAFLITGGQLASRSWTAILAIVLPLQLRKDTKYLMPYFFGVGFGLPALTITVLVLTSRADDVLTKQLSNIPSFLFGINEACISAIVLSFCLVTTIGCLVVYFRLSHEDDVQMAKKLSIVSNMTTGSSIPKESSLSSRRLTPIQENNGKGQQAENGSPVLIKIENLDTFCTKRSSVTLPEGANNAKNQEHSREPVEYICLICKSRELQDKEETELDDLDAQVMQRTHHVTLLIFLSVSMLVGLTTSLWKALSNSQTGIFVALEFLDIVLNYGQAVICCAVFGREVSLIVANIKSWYQSMKHGNCPSKLKLNPFQAAEPKDNKYLAGH